MSSSSDSSGRSEGAEVLFRAAFERLKANAPVNLPAGARVTQNNVAREAGREPASLKKSRFPSLIADIQAHIASLGEHEAYPSPALVEPPSETRGETIEMIKRERDDLLCQLMAAKVQVFEQWQKLQRLESEESQVVVSLNAWRQDRNRE